MLHPLLSGSFELQIYIELTSVLIACILHAQKTSLVISMRSADMSAVDYGVIDVMEGFHCPVSVAQSSVLMANLSDSQ